MFQLIQPFSKEILLTRLTHNMYTYPNLWQVQPVQVTSKRYSCIKKKCMNFLIVNYIILSTNISIIKAIIK